VSFVKRVQQINSIHFDAVIKISIIKSLGLSRQIEIHEKSLFLRRKKSKLFTTFISTVNQVIDQLTV